MSSFFFPELMSTHEFEKKELEENFEKLRLSLQVSVVSPASGAGVGTATLTCKHLSDPCCVLEPGDKGDIFPVPS